MAKKSNSIGSRNYIPKRMNRNSITNIEHTDTPLPIVRPGYCIGRLLALQQTDGVDGSTSQLFKGQYDDKYGDVDPACDIHTDPHMLKDALIQRGYNEKMSSQE